jgi:sugar-specific transcriptional regulator TrmB
LSPWLFATLILANRCIYFNVEHKCATIERFKRKERLHILMIHDTIYELEYLGFTPNEVKVYLTLLRIGRSKAGRLAKECGLERTSTYNALQQLIRQGLVSFVIEANKKVFAAAEPSRIVDLFKEKEERAALIVPKLIGLKKFEREKETILKFKGYSGIKTVFNDILRSCREGSEYLAIGLEGQLSERMPTFAEIFVARKDEKKLHSRALVRASRKGKKMSKYTKVRYVPQEVVSPININIYCDKVAMIMWSEIPEAVIIDNSQSAAAFRSYFEFMWKHAHKKPRAD